jgi:diguanylate cyclase (GGDEF)-like protein
MRISTRYTLVGAVVGLIAPVALLVYGIATRQVFDPIRTSLVMAAGGAIIFAAMGRMIGTRDEMLLTRNRELADLGERLRALSTTDGLTGLHNRRSFDDRLRMELARTARYGASCALVMVDLDHFKAINDRHGHQAGDQILRHVASLLMAESREGDLVARYGGEELAAILPHTTAMEAHAWAERVRARIEQEPTMWFGSPVNVTASFGVAAVPPSQGSPSRLLGQADDALYGAKGRGRNLVVVSEGTVVHPSPPQVLAAPSTSPVVTASPPTDCAGPFTNGRHQGA